ncbi:MAG TPA: hypothetical protein VF942_18825, partial [Acidimicrobiales bacterium]
MTTVNDLTTERQESEDKELAPLSVIGFVVRLMFGLLLLALGVALLLGIAGLIQASSASAATLTSSASRSAAVPEMVCPDSLQRCGPPRAPEVHLAPAPAQRVDCNLRMKTVSPKSLGTVGTFAGCLGTQATPATGKTSLGSGSNPTEAPPTQSSATLTSPTQATLPTGNPQATDVNPNRNASNIRHAGQQSVQSLGSQMPALPASPLPRADSAMAPAANVRSASLPAVSLWSVSLPVDTGLPILTPPMSAAVRALNSLQGISLPGQAGQMHLTFRLSDLASVVNGMGLTPDSSGLGAVSALTDRLGLTGADTPASLQDLLAGVGADKTVEPIGASTQRVPNRPLSTATGSSLFDGPAPSGGVAPVATTGSPVQLARTAHPVRSHGPMLPETPQAPDLPTSSGPTASVGSG